MVCIKWKAYLSRVSRAINSRNGQWSKSITQNQLVADVTTERKIERHMTSYIFQPATHACQLSLSLSLNLTLFSLSLSGQQNKNNSVGNFICFVFLFSVIFMVFRVKSVFYVAYSSIAISKAYKLTRLAIVYEKTRI